MTQLPPKTPIPGVNKLIAIASGKGGVGKSTISANLAVALAADGARVGLMDADIYGPSIPTIMGIDETPRADADRIIPLERHGVKVISMGFFIEERRAVVWRGPMLGKMLDEFTQKVAWGKLDYMIIDLPPGTGDVQLSLCQQLPLTGAVVVSTPQDVALKVAQKAINLFELLETPVLGLIENMSYFTCPHCGEREEIFGTGGTRRAAEAMKLPFLGALPLSTAIRLDSDNGVPCVVGEPESDRATGFKDIAQTLK
ncbi:MAG: Mrp/NBP35 family ATP-binding protein [bacterium]|nr:Mrp/NBP35 family ATP-binding protein [bacterium]